MEPSTEILIQQAIQGDKTSLEALVRQIQDRIYGLAMRMLGRPVDAEDATQEILVKIVTHLGSFRQDSSFSTWCFRIAANHLLTTRKRWAERIELTFEKCEEEIDRGLAHAWTECAPQAEQGLMVEDVMLSCMQGFLLCLERDLRITYILGEIFEVNSSEGAQILSITAAAFRKRLSRARSLLRDFMQANCGLIKESNPCRCERQIPYAVKAGFLNPKKPLFAAHPRRNNHHRSILEGLEEIAELQRVAVLFRRHPEYSAPDSFVESVRRLIDSEHFKILQV
ncbi:MAG: RNA polymerase sigma factor [Desulfomonile tiedjei]|nr:RNA polymerase sigma factor [Desulfomonile tiedjei]